MTRQVKHKISYQKYLRVMNRQNRSALTYNVMKDGNRITHCVWSSVSDGFVYEAVLDLSKPYIRNENPSHYRYDVAPFNYWRKVMSTQQNKWRLTFYMKSGNSFILDEILEWDVKNGLRGIESIRLKFSDDAKTKLIFSSVQVQQIECILEEKY